MQLLKKITEGFLLAGIFFLLFLVVFENRMHLPAWLQVIGRMHPMFLHFPITLLLVYFVVFWIPADDSSRAWVQVIGYIAAASAIITAIMGLLLSMQETFEGATFQRHKWGGISVALIACVFYYLYPYFIRKRSVGRPLTILSAILILITGHWGGNLTHGENYLLQPYAMEKKMVPFNRAIAFDDIVQPIFQTKCGACHSDGNSKGGLSLADSSGVLHGGKTGPFFISGEPDKSLFIQRVLLPLGNKKHMAPASKPQLSDEEVQLLSAWVKSGAPMHKKIIDLPLKDSFRLLAGNSLNPSETVEEIAYDFPAADEKLIRSLNNNYRVVTPEGQHSPALEVQFYGSRVYTPKSLEDLLAVKQQITDISLAKMPVKNDDLRTIAQMPNLQKLNINYTDITDSGIAHLTHLKNLKEITLSGTAISASALEPLLKLPSLRSVFIWNTPVDSNKVALLKRRYKKVRIETGFVDDGQNILPLNPPVAGTLSGVYSPGLKVKLVHPLKGVEIRYTLDGSDPDSVSSRIYAEPFTIDTFTVVRAKAFKQKWYGSKALKAVYFMKGLKPDSISIVSDEADNRGLGKLLFDLETGDMNVASGKWIGFKKPLTCYIFFNSPVTVHKLSLNMYTDNDSKTFLPEKIEIRGGMDKDKMRPLKTWSSEKPSNKGDADMVQPSVSLPETTVKCIELVIEPWKIKKTDVQCFMSEIVIQ